MKSFIPTETMKSNSINGNADPYTCKWDSLSYVLSLTIQMGKAKRKGQLTR